MCGFGFGLKLILGLVIATARTLDSYYVDALWLNNITLVAVAGLNFELLSSFYIAVMWKVFGKR